MGLTKHQFDALVHDEGVDADSMENIFDDPFRHRFTELINQTAQRNSASVGYNWPRRYDTNGLQRRNVGEYRL
jgi:hypothetical protein